MQLLTKRAKHLRLDFLSCGLLASASFLAMAGLAIAGEVAECDDREQPNIIELAWDDLAASIHS